MFIQTISSATDLTLIYTIQTIMEYINDIRFNNLDMDLSATKLLITTLINSSILTQEQANIIDDMANIKTSKAIQILNRPISYNEVVHAMENI